RQAFTFFPESARALSEVDPEMHVTLLSMAEELVGRSAVAAMEFLKSPPAVLGRVGLEEILHWHSEGSSLLDSSSEGGEAYFRMESSRGEEVLDSLSSRVDLSRVSDVLRMYCKALTGTEVAIHSSEALAEKGIGWVGTESPTTEGTAIFLAPWVGEFPRKEDNFSVYKVYSTHQAGHLEFSTFGFNFEREGRIFPNLRRKLETERGRTSQPQSGDGEDQAPAGPLTDMERFFDLFEGRRLASDLFAVVEDSRIDALVEREYAGIRTTYRQRQQVELERRPAVEKLPLLQAFVENLVRASLGGMDRIRWPKPLVPVMQNAVGIIAAVRQPQAIVEDSAEATIRLYQLAREIPNILSELMDQEEWQALDEEMMQVLPMTSDTLGESMDIDFPQVSPMPYESPQPVDFRGDFKPEMVQLLMRLRQERGGEQGPLSPLSPEQLRAMLEKSAEISLSDLAEADLTQSSG
ncbi:hypothetical protein LCGC14_2605390, partial [marine sediment metagenome]